MGFLFTKLFWGVLLILWGVVLVIEKVVNIRIPLTRFIFAFLLIYCGVYLIVRMNAPKRVNIKTKIKSEKSCRRSSENDYTVAFGSSIVDLSQSKHNDSPIEVNCVFGKMDIYLSPKETYKIGVNTVFGQTNFPNQKEANFGTDTITIGEENATNPIILEINTVFGTTNILMKNE